ncbi:MAG: DUF4830 domain-containing protein [Oscillospiraceae bacterium]|nr:DUF4830 domain-containing protein [Oscillospiraceae bacterium]
MFVFTAKLNRKSAVAVVVALALLLIAVILLVSLHSIGGSGKPAPETAGIADADDAARYLAGLGWQVEPQPLEIRELVIPRSFSGAYADYASLQEKQGYPLAEYGGMEARRYSFRVLNHPSGAESVVADLVVCGQTVIAGDIQSTALDGFMTGLKGET